MTSPKRIKLSRAKGWRLPKNAVNVARPTKWGNPFAVAEYGRDRAIANFRLRMEGMRAIGAGDLSELRGKDLACWCPLDQPCHADVLLELANASPESSKAP